MSQSNWVKLSHGSTYPNWLTVPPNRACKSVSRRCSLAYEFAKRYNLDVLISWDRDQVAGQDWWLGFKKRQNLTIRSPEATSFGRATAFNRPVVDKFFDNLANVMDKYKFSPSDIYNTDETGYTNHLR